MHRAHTSSGRDLEQPTCASDAEKKAHVEQVRASVAAIGAQAAAVAEQGAQQAAGCAQQSAQDAGTSATAAAGAAAIVTEAAEHAARQAEAEARQAAADFDSMEELMTNAAILLFKVGYTDKAFINVSRMRPPHIASPRNGHH